ncbi:tigger transposable element-derived protein 4-like protein, partial [Dinothrombium tinctorium]
KKQCKIGNRALALEFKCGKTQIDNIIKNEEEIRKQYEDFKDSSRKRVKQLTINNKINDAVFEFCIKARSKNITISGPMLQSKARDYAEIIGEDFKASN